MYNAMLYIFYQCVYVIYLVNGLIYDVISYFK